MPTESEMITLSGHFCASLYVGHEVRSRSVLNYRITVSGSPDLSHYFIQLQPLEQIICINGSLNSCINGRLNNYIKGSLNIRLDDGLVPEPHIKTNKQTKESLVVHFCVVLERMKKRPLTFHTQLKQQISQFLCTKVMLYTIFMSF